MSVWTADIGRWEIFIFIATYQLYMEELIYSETRQRDGLRFYDVIFGILEQTCLTMEDTPNT